MNFKKLTAILMALVMIFALSATAFATGNEHTVTVVISVEGDVWESANVTAADIANYKNRLQNADLTHLYDLDSNVDTNEVSYLNTYTATDAIMAGWTKGNINDPDSELNTPAEALASDEFSYTWFRNLVPNTDDQYVWGVYITNLGGLESDVDGYYVLEDSEEIDGVTYYTYHWEGMSWQLTIDGEEADSYSSEYAFNSIDRVDFDYTYMESESFTTTYQLW